MTAFQNPYRGVREMIALGATLISYSSDMGVLRASFEAMVKEVRR